MADNFLDVTLDLGTECSKTYRKPNNLSTFESARTTPTHPTSFKQIPLVINKRLAIISSTNEVCDKAAPDYQKTFGES